MKNIQKNFDTKQTVSKRIIAIDIDDTIVATREVIVKIANQQSGLNLGLEHYEGPGNYWDYYSKIWEQHGIDDIDPEVVYAELHHNQAIIPLLPGAEFAISELSKKYKIVLVTARSSDWEADTRQWLTEQFGDRAPELYFSEAHKGKAGSKTKGQICKEMGAEWLIDDHIDHCQSVLDEGLNAILFGEYGWHQDVPEGLIRSKDWQAVLEYFFSQENLS